MQIKKNPNKIIGRNSSIYFAIGLNIMLFISWQALEYKTYVKTTIGPYSASVYKSLDFEPDIEEEIPIVTYTVQMAPPPAVPVLGESIEIVEDDIVIEETFIESSEVEQSDIISPNTSYDPNQVVAVGNVVHVDEIEEEVEVPFAIIEEVPVFPGCEGLDNLGKKNCFQEKLQKHIQKHFIYPDEALELGIQGRVAVIFTIDSRGYVTNLKTRGPDKLLEQEAARIISLLPTMKAGKQRGRPVKVTYALPIFFKYAE